MSAHNLRAGKYMDTHWTLITHYTRLNDGKKQHDYADVQPKPLYREKPTANRIAFLKQTLELSLIKATGGYNRPVS